MRATYTPAHRRPIRGILEIRSVPGHVILMTAVASYGGIIIGGLYGWPLWGKVLAALVPWIPLFTMEMAWTYHHYGWLALFYLLTVTQVGHAFEHVAQMVQIHGLGLKGAEARGVFGALDVEWVHFGWNSWVLIATVALLIPYRKNAWLWATLVFAGWHEIEHAFIITRFLATGTEGLPGLLAGGGAIFGGLPFTRPDLHMAYNVIETIPLVVAFVWQVTRSHDQWLERVLPRLPPSLLLDLTRRAATVRLAPRETVVTQGHAADRFYAVVRGRLEVVCREDDGTTRVVGTLGPGDRFGEGTVSQTPCPATIRAVTAVELLALDRPTMSRVAAHYEAHEDELAGAFAPVAV